MILLAANPVLSFAAIIPAVILLVKVYKADRFEKEPTGLLISLVILGTISTAIAVVLETIGSAILGLIFTEDSVIYNFFMFFGVVAVSEECSKYILLKKKTWKSPHFNYRFDGVVYAAFVSLGFALWENLGYVSAYGLSTAFLRALTAVPGHACFGVFMGAWYGLAKACENSGNPVASKKARNMALLVPILLHGTYDFICSLGSYLMALIFIVFVVLMYIHAVRKVKTLSRNDYYIQNDYDRFGYGG